MQVERNNNNKHTRQRPIVNSCLGYCSCAIDGQGHVGNVHEYREPMRRPKGYKDQDN